MSETEIHKCACANCAWEGDVNDAVEIRNFWGRVLPGDTMPAGSCPECEQLVYLVAAAPPEEPIAAYLNLSGGEGAADHLILLHLDLGRLERLRAVARENDLDSVVIRPAFTLDAYGAIEGLPSDGYVGLTAVEELAERESDDVDETTEPTIRLDGLTLHVGASGYCYARGPAKHGEYTHSTEGFELSDLRAWEAASRASTPKAA